MQRDFWTKKPSIEIIKAEIEKGNDPTAYNAGHFDPVSFAILNDVDLESLIFLINQPKNGVNKPTHHARTYLHWAASKGNEALVKWLIANGSDVHINDSRGMSPLYYAALMGMQNTKIYDIFFQNGINPKQTYKDGETLMHLIVPNDKELKVSNYLISKGLSLKDTDRNGATVFDYACKKGDISILKELKKKKVKHTANALVFAGEGARMHANSLEVYQYLIEELKIPASSTNQEGQNALHFIAQKDKQTEIINYLVSKKINVHQQDKNGNTPFINAGRNRDLQALELLHNLTKNINIKNKKGQSALTSAVASASIKNIDFLLNQGADANITDQEGNNLAFYWFESFRPQNKENAYQILEKLQQKGVDFKAPQNGGNTLYHLAIINDNLDFLKELKPLQIDVNQKNSQGETPLIKACLVAKDDKILKYLLEIGADKNISTDFDETPYQIADDNEVLKEKNISVEFLK